MITWKYESYTPTWEAFNEQGVKLGYLILQEVGRHTHWCWCQDDDVWMSPGCLEEVRTKQKELFNDRKKTLRKQLINKVRL